MQEFERHIRLDDVLFVLALVVTAVFVADRFFADERDKTALAQAKELRKATPAKAGKGCVPVDVRPSDATRSAPCAKPHGTPQVSDF